MSTSPLHRLIAMTLAAVCLLGAAPVTAQDGAADGYRLAYLAPDARGVLVLYAIHPDAPQSAQPVYALAQPPGSGAPYASAASPDGRWAYAVFQRRGVPYADLIVFEAATGRIARWAALGAVPRANILAAPPHVRWSPDSRWLAYTSYTPNWFMGYSSDVYALDMAAPDTTLPLRLSEDNARQAQFGWSADSRQLAVTVWDCSATDCTLKLDVYALPGGERVSSQPLAHRLVGAHWMDSICQVTWSPDGQYVGYVEHCERPPQGAREVGVLDVQRGDVLHVTASGASLLEGERLVSWYVEHNITWADAHLLLAATALNHYAEDPDFGPRIVSLNQTAAVELPSKVQTVLSPNVVQEWAAAPQPDRFAYRLREVTPDGSPLAESVEIADFHDGQLQVAASGPAGCDWLLWSPDAEWLAYRDLGQYCWDQNQISLLNARDGRLERHTLLQTSAERVSWVGWLKIP